MLKRLVSCGLAILLIFTSGICAFASTQTALYTKEDERVVIQYKTLTTASFSLSFSGSTAKPIIVVQPKSGIVLDYVKVDAKLMKVGSSTPVATWSQTIYLGPNGKFSFSESNSVSERGKYYVVGTVKCYQNKKLVEEITDQSPQVTY